MINALATFGAGCFWGIEDLFRKIPGVVETAVGYMGGTTENPSYADVCTDKTGHAEVVQITYDASKVHYEDLLNLFWACHNPTTPNRQGPDVGTQYRSVIFFHTEEQEQLAVSSKEKIEQKVIFQNPIVTTILPAQTFYRAEEYHQQYISKQGLSSCHV